MPLDVLRSYEPRRSLRSGSAVHVSIHKEKKSHRMAQATGSSHSRSLSGRMDYKHNVSAERCRSCSVPAIDALNEGQNAAANRRRTIHGVKLKKFIPTVRAISQSESIQPTPGTSQVLGSTLASAGISSTILSRPLSSDSSLGTTSLSSSSTATSSSMTSSVRPPASEPPTTSTTRRPTWSVAPSSSLPSLPSNTSSTHTRSSSTSENESRTSSVIVSSTSLVPAPLPTPTSLDLPTGQLSSKKQPTASFTSTFEPTSDVASTMQTTTLPTVSTAVTSGILGHEPKSGTGFSRNTAAIIGVSVASTIVLLVGAVLLFFTCKRYRERRTDADNHSSQSALNVSSPQLSWRPPIDEDEDYFHAETYGPIIAAMQLPPVGEPSQTPSSDRSDKMTATVSGRASVSQQGYLPGFGQAAEVMAGADIARKVSNVTSIGRTPSFQDHLASTGNTSLVSIGRSPSLPSSQGHIATASSSNALLVPNKRSPEDKQSPPTSYKGKAKAKESDTGSIRSLFTRLRGGRSLPRLTIDVPQAAETPSDQAFTSPESFYPRPQSHSHSSYYPPPSSLLNPPSPETSPYMNLDSLQMRSVGWSTPASFAANTQPQLSLAPPTPLGTPTPSVDTRVTRDGLLHPSLLPRPGDDFHQASSGSLHDNVDYSRPIGGVVNSRMYSSTTITSQNTEAQDTEDTTDREEHETHNHS